MIFGNVFDMENIVACQLTCAAQQRRQRLVDRTSCLLSLGQSKPELLLKCPALLSASDINAFKISVKRLLAIFLPPPLPGPHGQLHPDVHPIVLLLGWDARATLPAASLEAGAASAPSQFSSRRTPGLFCAPATAASRTRQEDVPLVPHMASRPLFCRSRAVVTLCLCRSEQQTLLQSVHVSLKSRNNCCLYWKLSSRPSHG